MPPLPHWVQVAAGVAAIAAFFPGLLYVAARFASTFSVHVLVVDLLWLAGFFVVVFVIVAAAHLWQQRADRRRNRNR
jgi:membrane protein implicated in regulation of membrane protease activity